MSEIEILPSEEAASLRRTAETLLSSKWSLDRAELVRRGWTTVVLAEPFLDGSHGTWLERACTRSGLHHAVAVITEDTPEAFRVSLRAGALRSLHAEALLRPFLLWPEGFEFVVLAQGNYFMVVAGPSEFVRVASGGSVRRAFEEYESYVGSGSFSLETSKWLLETARRYRDLGAG